MIEQDKLLHFCIGIIITLITSLWIGITAVLIIAVGREFYNKTGFNWYDILSTVIGGIIGTVYILLNPIVIKLIYN